MAGMFYTLQEVIEKLKKNEAEIKTLVREGKLREFRDGTKQLYKTEDVDALVVSPKGDAAVVDDSLQLAIDETGEISLAPEEREALIGEGEAKNESKFKLDETGELLAEETLDKSGKSSGISAISEGDTKAAQPAQKEAAPAAGGTDIFAEAPGKEKAADDETKVSLSSDSINVLGGSDSEFKLSDDTSSETKLAADKGAKPVGEGDRLDEDVNLDASGSGSGLLDLALQADDTSLGAVLEDIYPENPAAATPAPEATPNEEAAAVPQAEQIFEEQAQQPLAEQAETPETAAVPSAFAFIAEPPADAASNTFGITLFIPLFVLIYTAIVIVSGYKPILELKMLSSVEPIIWYVVAGAAGLVIFLVLIGSFMGTGGTKTPKVKQPKPLKVKKEKKAKKEKETPPKEG